MAEKPDLQVTNAEPTGADVVQKLEETLDAAKDGRISSVAVAVVYRDGSTGNCWSKAPSLGLIVGSVARLQAQLLKLFDE